MEGGPPPWIGNSSTKLGKLQFQGLPGTSEVATQELNNTVLLPHHISTLLPSKTVSELVSVIGLEFGVGSTAVAVAVPIITLEEFRSSILSKTAGSVVGGTAGPIITPLKLIQPMTLEPQA